MGISYTVQQMIWRIMYTCEISPGRITVDQLCYCVWKQGDVTAFLSGKYQRNNILWNTATVSESPLKAAMAVNGIANLRTLRGVGIFILLPMKLLSTRNLVLSLHHCNSPSSWQSFWGFGRFITATQTMLPSCSHPRTTELLKICQKT